MLYYTFVSSNIGTYRRDIPIRAIDAFFGAPLQVQLNLVYRFCQPNETRSPEKLTKSSLMCNALCIRPMLLIHIFLEGFIVKFVIYFFQGLETKFYHYVTHLIQLLLPVCQMHNFHHHLDCNVA